MKKPLVIYHASCLDGFTAAWVVRKHFAAYAEPVDVDYHPGGCGQPPPDVTNRQVIIVDFSYPLEVLTDMAVAASSITVIDHHKTAQAALTNISIPGVVTYFDMDRSGARLAWDFYFPLTPVPDIVKFVEDRDLWKFHYEDTRAYCQYLGSFDPSFEQWDYAAEGGIETSAIIVLGEELLRQHDRNVKTCVRMSTRSMCIGGHHVPAANVPVMYSSDAGSMLVKKGIASGIPFPFAATYFDTPTGRQFSLRSTDEGIDVSEIAKLYGGGGHRNAAGFKVDRLHDLAMS